MAIERREKSPLEKPVGISKKTLLALEKNAKKLHWTSIRDRSLRDIFKRPGEMGIPGFTRESWLEVRGLILAFEENQRKREDEIPVHKLSIEGLTEVRLGDQYRPLVPLQFPPIFEPFSKRVIFLLEANRYEEIPEKMTLDEKVSLMDNLYVMKVLYGFKTRNLTRNLSFW